MWPSSITVTAVPARSGKGTPRHALWTVPTMCCTAIAASSQPGTHSSHRRSGPVSLVQLRGQSPSAGTLGTNTASFWPAQGNDAAGRSSAYRALLDEVPSDELLADIRIHLQHQRALGHDVFFGMVEAKTRHSAGVRPAHRPTKSNTAIK